MDTGHGTRQYSGHNSSSIPVNSPSIPQGSAKKRRTSTSGRGVANLTPEQLNKKRANDREAQRAIRERTKGQIESLERKIQELTSQQPYQELQHAVRQKELVEAENEEIKKRLSSVLGIIQPMVGGSRVVESIPSPCHDLGGPPPISTSDINAVQPVSPHASAYNNAPSGASTSSTYSGSPHQAQGHTPPFISHAPYTSLPNAFAPINVLERRQPSVSHGLQSRSSDEKLDVGYVLQSLQETRDGRRQYDSDRTPSLPPSSALPMNPLSPSHNARDNYGNQMFACSVPVRNIRTCPLDGLLLDFLAERRQRAIEGMPNRELVGPAYPSVVSLLKPQRSLTSHPLSKMFTDMLSTFPDLSTLPEQVGVLYIMFLIMRWQISPTQENYDRLPEWVTPRPAQLFSTHPAWVDYLPWPRMRDKLVQIYPSIHFDDFFIPYTTTLSLNWTYEAPDTLLSKEGTEELFINPVFERHIRDLKNWTLGPAFAKAHPSLADTCTIKPDNRRRSS